MKRSHELLPVLAEYYKQHARSLPWRQPEPDGRLDPYKILVSEIMLQQTQVNRVIPKYNAFLERFPTINALAAAPLADVLMQWVGLGYNRRAKYLWQAAQQLVDGVEPWTMEQLVACKGIGVNTAAAVLVYSYDLPLLFLETNIKTVLIHHCFGDRTGISDAELLEALTVLVPWNLAKPLEILCSPRVFYWSMMDYGTYLKSTVGNQTHRSKGHTRHSAFKGSRRAVRGQVIRLLADGPLTITELQAKITDGRLADILTVLEAEQLIAVQNNTLMLYNGNQK